MSQDNFFQKRITAPILGMLREGLTPERIALSMAVGLAFGVFPAIGWTTILCTVVALRFRLNLVAMQLINYLAYPLQLALMIPFMRAGEKLFHSGYLPSSLAQILEMIRADAWHAAQALWVVTLHAIVVWALVAPIVVYAFYKAATPLLRRFAASNFSRP